MAILYSPDRQGVVWMSLMIGTIVAHNDPTAIGTSITELLGPAIVEAPETGMWVTASALMERTWRK